MRPAGKLSLICSRTTKIDEGVPPIHCAGKDTDRIKRDVAFLEIDRAFLERHLEKTPIPLSRIRPCGVGEATPMTAAVAVAVGALTVAGA